MKKQLTRGLGALAATMIIGLAAAGCSASGSDAAANEQATTPTAGAPETAKAAKTTSAPKAGAEQDVADALNEFLAAVNYDVVGALAAQTESTTDMPSIEGAEEQFKESYAGSIAFIDGSVATSEAQALVGSLAVLSMYTPEVEVTAEAGDVKLKEGEAVVSGSDLNIELDGAAQELAKDGSAPGDITLRSVDGKWVITGYTYGN